MLERRLVPRANNAGRRATQKKRDQSRALGQPNLSNRSLLELLPICYIEPCRPDSDIDSRGPKSKGNIGEQRNSAESHIAILRKPRELMIHQVDHRNTLPPGRDLLSSGVLRKTQHDPRSVRCAVLHSLQQCDRRFVVVVRSRGFRLPQCDLTFSFRPPSAI